MSISFVRRALMLVFGLVLCVTASLSMVPVAQAQHTSAQCAAKSGSVARGGTVSVDVTDCAYLLGFAGTGSVDGPLQPTHGSANLRLTPTNWIVDYSHNGNTATSDAFEFSDASIAGGTVRVTITITAATSSITVSPGSLSAMTAGTAFTQALSSSGGVGPYIYALDGGTLPVGLSLASNGVISGTPTQRGGYTFGVRSTDSTAEVTTKGYTGTVQNPTITLSPTTYTIVQGIPTSFQLKVNGGVAPYSYLLELGPALPPGLTVSSSGVVSGTPTTAGSTTPNFRVTDSSTGPGQYFELESPTIIVTASPPSVSIAVAPSTVTEDGATNLTYTVSRSVALASSTTVNLTTSGTATSGSDYTGSVTSVVIPSGALSATVTINPSADSVIESNETVILTVAAGAGYTVGAPASATGTITNDDVSAGTSTLCPNLYATVAYGGSVSVDATACHAGFGLGNIATQGTHGTGSVGPFGPSQFINYAHNGTSGTTDTFVVRDGNSPPNNLIQVNITITPPTSSIVVSPANLPNPIAGAAFSQTLTSTGGTGPYTYTLSSGTLPVGLSLSSAGVLSGTPTQRGTYTFSVQSQNSLGATAVKGYTGSVQNPSLALAVSTGTANQGSAYSQTLVTNGGVGPYTYQLETGSFPAGITISSAGIISGTTAAAPGSYPVTLRVTDSSTGPGSYFELETFTLEVASLPSVSIAVAPASVSEDGATNLTYTVTRSVASASPLTVNLTTSGTATSSTDYIGGAATVTIAANATTATLVINPTIDANVEADETVILTVATGTGYTVGAPASATGTILNDDVPSVSIAVAPANVSEDGATNLVYTVTLNQPSLTATSVNFAVSGTATSGTDFAAVSSSLVIAAGATSGTITVNPTTDVTIEADETVVLTLSAGAGYTVGAPATATGTILNDDSPSVSIAVSPASVSEDGTTNLIYTLTLSQASASATSVNLTTTGTATSGGDYAALTSPVIIAAGATTATVTVNPTVDTTVEPDETVTLTVAAGSGYTVSAPSSATGTILNDDVLTASIAVSPASVSEDGAINLIYTVTLDQAFQSATSVNFTMGGTATSGADFAAVSSPLVIAAGATSATITVNPTADAIVESDETVVLTLSAGAGYAVGAPAAAIGTLLNDDTPSVSIAVSAASVSEDGAIDLVYTLTLSQASASATSVNLTASGTATSGADYATPTSPVVIPAGATTATVTIDPSVDTTVELDETVTLTVATGTGYTVGAPASATGTILNDDVPTASIAVSPASVSENGATNLTYTVTLDQASQSATSVNFAVSGTAASGTDFDAVTSPLVIAAGATSATVTVNPTADATVEPDETVVVTLSPGTGYIVGAPAAATGTILNDDLPTLTISDVAVNEGDVGTTTASFTVSLPTPAGPGGVTFDIATTNGTATAGMDYVAQSLAAQIIPAGASTYTFDVLINGDLLNEPLETFVVNVTNVAGAVVGDAQGVGTIQDDDGVPTLSINDVSLIEGNSGSSNAVFTVSLDTASGQTVTVNYVTANGTATNGSDYMGTSGTLTFAPGVLTQSVTVAVLGDVAVEADETFAVNLSGAVNAAIGDGAGQGTIQNDDAAPVLTSIAPASGPASGGTTVTLNGSDLAGATAVFFGATQATGFTVNSSTSITATVPLGSGVVDVTVTTPSGTSANAAAARFTYIGAPVVSGLSLTTAYNAGGATAANLDLSTGVTGSVSSYAVGAAANGTVIVTGSQAQYTPNVGYAGPDSFTFTATGPGGTSNPATVNVTVTLPSLTLTPGSLANGQRAQAYSATLVAGGSVGPYTYAVTGGALPSGLTLTSGGILSGTPQASGAFNFTVTATDSSSGAGPFSVVRGYGLNIGAATIALTPADGALPGATVGVAYNGAVSADGGIAPYSFAVTTGALPAGLTLASNGSLTGTPTTSGAFTFTVTATDAATAGSGGPYTGSVVYSLWVGDAAPVAAAASLTVAYGAGATPVSPVLSGGPTTSVAVATAPARGTATASGATLTYTPNAGAYGTDSFTYMATGPGGTSAPATVSVTISAPTLSISPTTLTDAQEDVAYSASLTASGGAAPYSFAVTAGALPTGLTLASDGVLSGVPTAEGNYGFTVTVTDSSTGAGPASISQAFSLTVGAPPPPVAVSPPGTIPAEGGSRGGEPVRIDLSALVSGDVTEIRIGTPPQNGTLTLESVAGPNGPIVTAIYTANAGFEGADSFTFLAVGPGGTSAPATVSLNVVGLDPTAPNLTATTEQGRPVTVNLTATATEGPFTDAAIVSISPASAATASLVPGGTATNRTYAMTITPRADFDGVVVVTYTLSNSVGTSLPATVTLTVSTRPDPSADPDVRALSTAQAQAAREFATTQLGNFNRRNEQLHGDGRGGSAMGLSLTSGRNGLFEGPLDDLPWAQRERQLADDREASLFELPDHMGRLDTSALGVAVAQTAVSGGGPRETGDIAFWSGGAVTVGGYDETARTSSFDVSTSGISAGADVKVSDQLTIGAGGGYGSQRTDIGESETGRLDGETWSGAVYGSYRPSPGVFIDGVLGYGSLSFDTRRLAANNLIALGERDGDMVMASLTAGWDRQRGSSLFSTYGRIDYVLTTLDAYSETGAGLYNLAFAEREFESVVGAMGIRGQMERQFRDSILIQTGRLEWRHEFGGLDGQALDYADIGGFRYVIDGERWMRDELAAELGLEMRYDSGLVLGVDVGGRFSNGSQGATLRFLLAKRF